MTNRQIAQAVADSVNRHYGRSDLTERLLARLREVGLDLDALTVDDLAPIDQFHVGGFEATRELANLVPIDRDWSVLDIGCGIGGPARLLASQFGCQVVGIDVTRSFCQVGRELNRRMGLDEQVSIVQGSALALPWAGRQFDLVWMQHVSMNIADKGRLYSEATRVLKPKGRLAAHEILARSASGIRYPVPWARDESISFVMQEEELRSALQSAGLKISTWEDVTVAAIAFFEERQKKAASEGPPPLSVATLMGDDFPQLAANVLRNLQESRLAVVRYVCTQGERGSIDNQSTNG